MASKQVTKPGKHGTLKLYEITYRDVTDHCNHWTVRVWRYSLEHVYDAFYSDESSDGWELVKAQTVGETGIVGTRPVHTFGRIAS